MSNLVETPAPILRTPGVCSGDACVRNTRIMVWLLVLMRRRGATDADLLANYPSLTPDDLDATWDYYRHHPAEIEQAIWLSVTALDHPPGTPVPAGDLIQARLLGLSDEQIRSAYDPPLSQAELDIAWETYRHDPQRIDRQIAQARSVA